MLTPPQEKLEWSNHDGIPVTLTAIQTPEVGHGWGFIATISDPKDCPKHQSLTEDTVAEKMPNSIVISVSSGFYSTKETKDGAIYSTSPMLYRPEFNSITVFYDCDSVNGFEFHKDNQLLR